MRRPTLRLAILVLCAATAAGAETRMTAEEFEAFATGRTLDFANEGGVFGTEEYLPGRRVRWAGTDGQCMTGSWHEWSGHVCFVYDGDPFRHCWTLWRDGAAVTARSFDDQPGDAPRRVTEAAAPLACRGPDVGV